MTFSTDTIHPFLLANEVLDQRIWKRPLTVEDCPLSILLLGFFRFYHSEFNSRFVAVSIRLGRDADMLKTGYTGANGLFRFSIEDPFETYSSRKQRSHDLGSHANSNGQNRITECLKVSYDRMNSVFANDKDSESSTTVINKLFKIDDEIQNGSDDKDDGKEQARTPKKKSKKEAKKKKKQQQTPNNNDQNGGKQNQNIGEVENKPENDLKHASSKKGNRRRQGKKNKKKNDGSQSITE